MLPDWFRLQRFASRLNRLGVWNSLGGFSIDFHRKSWPRIKQIARLRLELFLFFFFFLQRILDRFSCNISLRNCFRNILETFGLIVSRIFFSNFRVDFHWKSCFKIVQWSTKLFIEPFFRGSRINLCAIFRFEIEQLGGKIILGIFSEFRGKFSFRVKQLRTKLSLEFS